MPLSPIVISYERYDPSKGYSWKFPNETSKEGKEGVSSKALSQFEQPSEEQRRKVDRLLTDLVQKFPPKAFGRRVSLFAVKYNRLFLLCGFVAVQLMCYVT